MQQELLEKSGPQSQALLNHAGLMATLKGFTTTTVKVSTAKRVKTA
jgi:hypothetical protein